MRSEKLQIAALALLMAATPAPALPRSDGAQAKSRGAKKAERQAEKEQRRAGRQEQLREHQALRPGRPGSAEMPPLWMQRLQGMSPEQQQRFLQNNEHFNRLPPERQARIRQNLERWNRLTPELQQEFILRQQRLQRLTPDQRHRLEDEIMPRWRQLPPDRRQAIRRRLSVLGQLDENERAAKLNDENFLQGMSPEDRSLLRDLASFRLGPPPEHNDPPPEDQP